MHCKLCGATILYDAKRREYYHPSVIVAMVCPNPIPAGEVKILES